MSDPVRILLVDDNPDDRALILRELRRELSDPHVEQITEAESLGHRLEGDAVDLVITDYQLRWTHGLEILRAVKLAWPDCPVIMFTATGNEEVAVEGMKEGLDDYVVKSTTHLVRLSAAARAALRRAKERRDAQEVAARYRRLFEGVPVGLYRTTPTGEILEVNAALQEMLGYADREALQQLNADDLYHDPEERRQWKILMEREGIIRAFKAQFCCRDGTTIWVEDNARAVRDAENRVLHFEGSLEDITERKRTEENVRRQLRRLGALHNIDRAINASVDLGVILDVILAEVTAQLEVDAAAVLLLSPHTQMLEYGAGRGFRTATLEATHLRVGEGHAGLAAMERRVVHIPDLEAGQSEVGHALRVAGEDFVAYYAAPLIAKGQVKGVLEVFHLTALDADPDWEVFLTTLAAQAAIAIDNSSMFDDLERSHTELILAYDTTLEGWVKALDLRDEETEGHTLRVTEMTLRLAREIGLSDTELVHVRRGALLHDIGKMGIPDGILLKPGALTDAEWEIMRKHPVYAYEMLSPIAFLRPAMDIPYCHHEKWDGSGYPRGLRGDRIPLVARIFAVVDVWDALFFDRPYRAGWEEKKVVEHLREQAGKHFDPEVVESFLQMRERHGVS